MAESKHPSASAQRGRLPWKKVLLTLLILGIVACSWEFISSQNPYLLPMKRALKYDLLHLSPISEGKRTAGLTSGYTVEHYGDGKRLDGDFAGETDRKTVYRDGEKIRLVNELDGYRLDFPAGTEFDFSLSPLFVRVRGEGYDGVISREIATYNGLKDVVSFEFSTLLPFLLHDETVKAHVDYYEYRFLLSPEWQESNGVTVEIWTGEDGTEWISAVLEEPGEAEYDSYLYATVYTGSREYLRVMFRYHSNDTALRAALTETLWDPMTFDPTGAGVYATDYRRSLPTDWSEETARAYEEMAHGEALQWGIFTQDIFETGLHETVPELEKKLDYRFNLLLAYLHFGHDFPAEFMEENRQAGRLVELTWQITDSNNENLFGYTPFLDIYRGKLDGELREFARQAAAWGYPFLFRLNNEMNSDWTSYSGVVNLCDPGLFVSAWQRVYRIFREEGVTNCIWIYNPNDRNAPPSKWNDSLAYYPGNGYAQMLGVTGYNNGTYYTQWREQWREFTQIYDEIQRRYEPHFSDFPWIITEFASSSVGGDKAAWMDNMFAHIGDYPNIKAAVWFSYADFDGDIPARPYWLDETEETLAAFRRGLHGGE
ncbi:MAG: glycoside hydrolase family 26 protein [Oscillospiraceae bacterium]|nr:glycoside hydrolase family 26 protein [Oscillospiraceae bacterium]